MLIGKVFRTPLMLEMLKKVYPFKGTLRRASVVPVDKLRPDNLIRAVGFVNIISKFPLEKFECVNKKLLKNTEGISRIVRRNLVNRMVSPCDF